MEPVIVSSATGKRASRSSTISSSDMDVPKLDVNSESQGRSNPSFNHEENNDIPENQTYYADELISVPDLEKVKYSTINLIIFINNFCILH
jgi:hypothetical protein